jgi:hypothetical protein
MEAAPKQNGIKECQCSKKNCSYPLPPPRNRQKKQDKKGWDQVHQKSQSRLPDPEPLVEDIQRKKADERREDEAQNAGYPEQDSLRGSRHSPSVSQSTEFPLIEKIDFLFIPLNVASSNQKLCAFSQSLRGVAKITASSNLPPLAHPLLERTFALHPAPLPRHSA